MSPTSLVRIRTLVPMPERKRLVLIPIGDDPEVGRWLAAMEDGRADTLKELAEVSAEMVDWYPSAPLNSIGSLLYHIALVEASWVAEEILEVGEPHELAALLPWPDRDAGGLPGNERHLSRIDGQSLEQHLERLAAIRRWVLEQLKPMTNEDFHRVRSLDDYDAAPDWVLHHVLQHEAEHRSHIAWLRDTFAARASD
jgi:hypothetical protein